MFGWWGSSAPEEPKPEEEEKKEEERQETDHGDLTPEENKSQLEQEIIGEKELLPQVLRDNLAIIYGCQSGK